MVSLFIQLVMGYELVVGLPVLGFSITRVGMGYHGMNVSDGVISVITAVEIPYLAYLGSKARTDYADRKSVRVLVEYSNFSGDVWNRDSRTKTEAVDFTATRFTFYFFPDRLFNIGIRASMLQLTGAIRSRSGVLIAREYIKDVIHTEALFRFQTPLIYNSRIFLQKGYDLGVSGDLGFKTFEMVRDVKIKNFKYYSSSLGFGFEYKIGSITLSFSKESVEFIFPVEIENCFVYYKSTDKLKYNIISGGISYAF